MIREPHLVQRLRDAAIRAEQADYASNLRVFEALWNEAVTLGVLPGDDPLDGIDVDIRLAEVLNVRKSPGSDRSRT